MYCRYCGSPLPDDAKFCPNCGASVFGTTSSDGPQAAISEKEGSSNQPTTNNTNYGSSKSKKHNKSALGWFGILVVVVVFCLYVFFPTLFSTIRQSISSIQTNNQTVSSTKTPSTPKPTAVPRATPYIPSPSPYSAKNGEIIIAPEYEGVCEIKVIADEGTDYYVYLKYVGEPTSSSTKREVTEKARTPYESDLSFYVKAGQKATVKIPVGKYKFYYSTGTVFYGKKDLFGDSTNCFSSSELLEFYTTKDSYVIQTITLYKVPDGNFSTKPIKQSDFPRG